MSAFSEHSSKPHDLKAMDPSIFHPFIRSYVLGQELRPFCTDHSEDARSLLWRPKVKKILDQDISTLFAVGQAHLEGPYGLLAYLKELGLSYERVQIKPRSATPEMKKYLEFYRPLDTKGNDT